jgi:hypothetical protein
VVVNCDVLSILCFQVNQEPSIIMAGAKYQHRTHERLKLDANAFGPGSSRKSCSGNDLREPAPCFTTCPQGWIHWLDILALKRLQCTRILRVVSKCDGKAWPIFNRKTPVRSELLLSRNEHAESRQVPSTGVSQRHTSPTALVYET